MEFRPIGHVRNDIEGQSDLEGREEKLSVIELLPEYVDGLYRIEWHSEVEILFHLDRSQGYEMVIRPRNDPANPEVGVFATRSPNRPNGIAVTRVKVIEHSGNRLVVKGLDAFNGTPVIDIKCVSWPPANMPKGMNKD